MWFCGCPQCGLAQPAAASAVSRQWAAVATPERRARMLSTTRSPSSSRQAGPRTVVTEWTSPRWRGTVPSVQSCGHAVAAVGDAHPGVRHFCIPPSNTWSKVVRYNSQTPGAWMSTVPPTGTSHFSFPTPGSLRDIRRSGTWALSSTNSTPKRTGRGASVAHKKPQTRNNSIYKEQKSPQARR